MRTRFESRQMLDRVVDNNDDISSREMFKIIDVNSTAEFQNNEVPRLFAFVNGIDPYPRPMNLAEVKKLGDVFSQELLLKNKTPQTLRQLLNYISELSGDITFTIRKMFLVAEGGQHHLNHPAFTMNARLVFTWQKSNARPPDILLSTVPALDNTESLLQLIAWSSTDNAFHFFERKQGMWGWAGNSYSALNPLSRGKGPFDSHINGGLVMKELKFPWSHWHSQSSTISRANFEKESEFNIDPQFSVLNGAEELEAIVKTGIRRWTQSRMKNDIKDDVFHNLTTYLRQVLTPTSVNLVSSSMEFHRVENNTLKLPSTFFLDLDGLELAIMAIDLLSDAVPADRLEINGALFKEKALGLNMNIINEDGISLKGDTHFCFLVPERAFEDLEVCRQLIEKRILSAKMVLCMLMVDFSNPLDSLRRSSLLKYCPNSVKCLDQCENFENVWLSGIRQSGLPNGSPEEEFLSYWNDPDLLVRIQNELHSFFMNIQQNLNKSEYITNLLILAEYRKDFYRKRKFDDLDEFLATTSRAQIEPRECKMDKQGNIINF